MMDRRPWMTVLFAGAAAAVLTALAALGVPDRADLALSDRLYQRPQARSGRIVLVQIDQKAVDTLGPYDQWGRSVMADVIDALNRSEDCHPAVIGLDVLYAGETSPEQDARLAEAAGRFGNVVTASAASFGTVLEPDGAGDYRALRQAAANYERPYETLDRAATAGHINAMLDEDGVLRHHLLTLRLPDGERVESFALAVARLYSETAGGALTLPETDSRGFWYLPFSAGPGDYSESISVADVLSGAVDPEYFNGKIVLVGPYAPAFQDSCLTAVDHAVPMYGLEVQANAIEALLRGQYQRQVPDRVQLAALLAVCMGLFFAFWKRPVKLATAVLALVCAGWVLLCRLAFGAGYVLRPLWVPVCAAALYVGCLAANYIRAVMAGRRVMNTFRRYVAPEIVRELLKQDPASLALGGKLTDIAVLFVDVRGFTSMSELLAPEQVVEILNRYLTLISDCILRHGGTLDKFVGDAAMAFWGAPLPQPDPVMQAARTAMDMVKGSRELNRELEERFGRTVSFGIGVHTGPAVVGNIGSPRRMDYTAIGDTVNTAARLEANAPGGTVYISRAVADALGGRAKTRSLGGSVKLKGKAEGFEVLVLEELPEPGEAI